MNILIEDIQLLMNREITSLIEEIEMFSDDEIIWKVLPGITNSAANLTLHICGNLNYFIGAVLGKTGYIRDRESEFNRKSGSRTELVAELRKTLEMIHQVLSELSESLIADIYPQTVGGVNLPCGRFLMHLATHLSFHIGQIGYLRRILTGTNLSSGAVSLGAINV